MEDQDGNRYDIPDDIIDDNNNNNDDDWGNDNDDWIDNDVYPDSNGDQVGVMGMIDIIHKPCGKVVKTIVVDPADSHWEGYCYCGTCKQTFYVVYD